MKIWKFSRLKCDFVKIFELKLNFGKFWGWNVILENYWVKMNFLEGFGVEMKFWEFLGVKIQLLESLKGIFVISCLIFGFCNLREYWMVDLFCVLGLRVQTSKLNVWVEILKKKKKIDGLSLVCTVLVCLYQYVGSFCLEVCHFQIVRSWVKTKNWRC